MLGQVQLNKLNLMQGELKEVERYVLYVGRGAGVNEGNLVTLGQTTDLDLVLGDGGPLSLKSQIEYARNNAGQNWSACVIPLAPEGSEGAATWAEAVDFAMERVSVEGIALTDPVTSVAEVENMQTKTEQIMARYMRPLWMAGRARAITPTETFQEYMDSIRPLQQNVAADQVTLTPSLGNGTSGWGNELGTYLGRLCNHSVSVADSPMRVETGPLIGNWAERPVDSSGRVLDISVLEALDSMRFSVPQWYPDYDGTYWADGNTLDVNGGDYQVIENLRVIQKAMRRVYPLLVSMIGNRRFNQTPASMARTKTFLMRPLREMSRSTMIMGHVFPGDIMPPEEGDITLTWITRTYLDVGIAARPYNNPKKIVCNLALDLTNYA